MTPASLPGAVTRSGTDSETQPCTLRELMLYFLALGTFGFGGPIALAGYMQRDLVEDRRWFSMEDYKEGLALSQLSPGPLAAQLAKYLGWVRAGALGATLVALAFIGPSFLMVLTISWLYLHFGGLPWIQALFYGIGAAVIAIIARSAYKLARATVNRDPVLIGLFVVSAVVTGWTEKEYIWLFFGCGFVAMMAKSLRSSAAPFSALIAFPLWLTSGIRGPQASELPRIAWYFAEAGAFVFGSGLAIVPFLHGGVVDQFHWLNERQFLDAVAVAMITPGPVVITVAFIGFLVAGFSGAVVSAIGVFLPPCLIVIFLAPHFRKWSSNAKVKTFVAGVTAAAAGAIGGAAYVLGRRAIIDLPTIVIALVAFAILTKTKKVPEPLLILSAGLIGLLVHPAAPH